LKKDHHHGPFYQFPYAAQIACQRGYPKKTTVAHVAAGREPHSQGRYSSVPRQLSSTSSFQTAKQVCPVGPGKIFNRYFPCYRQSSPVFYQTLIPTPAGPPILDDAHLSAYDSAGVVNSPGDDAGIPAIDALAAANHTKKP
jgi:hypothetical protein